MALSSQPCAPTALLEEGMCGTRPGCQGKDGAHCYLSVPSGRWAMAAPRVGAPRGRVSPCASAKLPSAPAGVHLEGIGEQTVLQICGANWDPQESSCGDGSASPMSICQACPPAPATQSCCDLSSPEAQAVLVMTCAEDQHSAVTSVHPSAPGMLPDISLAAAP